MTDNNNHVHNRTLMLVTVILMDLLAGMEFDLFIPSFPELQQHFGVSVFWTEALLSVNFIGYALSLFFVGSLADSYGRKPIIIFGLIIFIIGSIFCLSETSYVLLLLGRFLQGIGVAAPAILSFLIIADNYPLKKQQFFMSILNGVMNTSVAIAPVIGSYITLYFSWKGNFLTLLILGVVVLIMTYAFIPNYKISKSHTSLHVREYLPLFQSKTLMLLVVNIVAMFLPYWIFVGMSPILYMKDLGVSLAYFGYYQGALALVFAVGSILFGLIVQKINHHKALYIAGWLYFVSIMTIWLVIFKESANPLWITLAFIPFIISQIIPSNLLIPVCLNFIPEKKGKISAMLQGFRLIFAALSLQIASYFYTGSFGQIGIVVSLFIIVALITHVFVIRNQDVIALSDSTK